MNHFARELARTIQTHGRWIASASTILAVQRKVAPAQRLMARHGDAIAKIQEMGRRNRRW